MDAGVKGKPLLLDQLQRGNCGEDLVIEAVSKRVANVLGIFRSGWRKSTFVQTGIASCSDQHHAGEFVLLFRV